MLLNWPCDCRETFYRIPLRPFGNAVKLRAQVCSTGLPCRYESLFIDPGVVLDDVSIGCDRRVETRAEDIEYSNI